MHEFSDCTHVCIQNAHQTLKLQKSSFGRSPDLATSARGKRKVLFLFLKHSTWHSCCNSRIKTLPNIFAGSSYINANDRRYQSRPYDSAEHAIKEMLSKYNVENDMLSRLETTRTESPATEIPADMHSSSGRTRAAQTGTQSSTNYKVDEKRDNARSPTLSTTKPPLTGPSLKKPPTTFGRGGTAQISISTTTFSKKINYMCCPSFAPS
jgi:hypothetical protein